VWSDVLSGYQINQNKEHMKFKVTFKETYMPHEVTRICDVQSEEEVKRIYGLDDDDIEYYMITKL
jgi:hypothetical protein